MFAFLGSTILFDQSPQHSNPNHKCSRKQIGPFVQLVRQALLGDSQQQCLQDSATAPGLSRAFAGTAGSSGVDQRLERGAVDDGWDEGYTRNGRPVVGSHLHARTHAGK